VSLAPTTIVTAFPAATPERVPDPLRPGDAAAGSGRRACRRRLVALALSVSAMLANVPAAAQPTLASLLGALDLAAPATHAAPPPFAARTLDGAPVSLDGLRGRVLLIAFWTTWCPPCRQEMAHFEHLHREFGPAGLSVLAVNAYEDADAVTAFGRELQLSLPLLLDPEGDLLRTYAVIGLPTTLLVARDGRTVGRAVGARDWGGNTARSLVRTLLAEPLPPGVRR
jgi:thiol-disulfide isomerase/thioredoxin